MSEGESESLRLLGLLLQCAECVAMDHLDDAAGFVPEMSELSSPFGSSAERVAAYFGDALQARKILHPQVSSKYTLITSNYGVLDFLELLFLSRAISFTIALGHSVSYIAGLDSIIETVHFV